MYAKRKGWLTKLSTTCGKTEAEIEAGCNELPDYDPSDPNASAKYPKDNLISECLQTSDRFGIYLVRICFKMDDNPIPEGNGGKGVPRLSGHILFCHL